MKKRRKIITILIIIFAVLIVLYYYLLNKAEFTKRSHPSISIEMLEVHEVLYFGYEFNFEGFGNPTLQDIYLIQTDGEIVQQNKNQISITSFIDKSKRIGIVKEKYAIDQGIVDELIHVSGFKLKDSVFNLAFKVEFLDMNNKYDFNTLVIEYSHLGITKKQYIDFEGLFY